VVSQPRFLQNIVKTTGNRVFLLHYNIKFYWLPVVSLLHSYCNQLLKIFYNINKYFSTSQYRLMDDKTFFYTDQTTIRLPMNRFNVQNKENRNVFLSYLLTPSRCPHVPHLCSHIALTDDKLRNWDFS
jgi:hypothetical protein